MAAAAKLDDAHVQKRRRLNGQLSSVDVLGRVLSRAGQDLVHSSANSAAEDATGPLHIRTEARPFKTLELDGLFDDGFLDRVREQLLTQTQYTQKSSDLFSYAGTEDLSSVGPDTPLADLRSALYSEGLIRYFGDHLNVHLSLQSSPDASSHIYRQGDFLAAHDDDIRENRYGRRIAFILYLVDRAWSTADGGALGLYDIDGTGQPDRVVRSIHPKFGRLALFEVTPISFHEVSEVLSTQHERLSISGWYHGPLNCYAQLSPLVSRFNIGEMNLWDFVDHRWRLDPASTAALRDRFAESGFVELPDFLAAPVFAQHAAPLRQLAHAAPRVGPASARRFRYTAQVDDAILRLFESVAFRDLLQELTGLTLTGHRAGLRAIEAGDYSLLHDRVQDPCGLDVTLGLQAAAAVKDTAMHTTAGTVTYVLSAEAESSAHAAAAEEPLLRIAPTSNVLTIVLRDQVTLKYIERVSIARLGGIGWQRTDVDALYAHVQ